MDNRSSQPGDTPGSAVPLAGPNGSQTFRVSATGPQLMQPMAASLMMPHSTGDHATAAANNAGYYNPEATAAGTIDPRSSLAWQPLTAVNGRGAVAAANSAAATVSTANSAARPLFVTPPTFLPTAGNFYANATSTEGLIASCLPGGFPFIPTGPKVGSQIGAAGLYGASSAMTAPSQAQSTSLSGHSTPTTGPPASSASSVKTHLRKAAGQMWSDPTLDEWDSSDFRVFCGDLGNEVTDELLSNAFRHFKSFQKARVIRDKRTGKGRGYGFVSFTDPHDMLRALQEMDRKYVGNRPIRVMKSKWREREIGSAQNKRFNDSAIPAPDGSKLLKKFKAMKPVTGGKKATALTTPAVGSNNVSTTTTTGGRPFRGAPAYNYMSAKNSSMHHSHHHHHHQHGSASTQ